MKIHRAEIIGTFITVTGSTTNLTGSFIKHSEFIRYMLK